MRRPMEYTRRLDHMGMLATTINALAVADVLEQKGRVLCGCRRHEMRAMLSCTSAPEAIWHMEKGRNVIFGAAVPVTCFSTDTARKHAETT